MLVLYIFFINLLPCKKNLQFIVKSTTIQWFTLKANIFFRSEFSDVSGLAKVRQVVTGACRKCGYPGHLPFQYCCFFFSLLRRSVKVRKLDKEHRKKESKKKKKNKNKKEKKKHKKIKSHRKRR
ncbi:unnamed protein product [Angiostrongylus costaricensis]|uniref:Secreted protein n=1 Tax=Angiostrongylus costaricensis TaxID=334426 RepID=A0A0R3PF06_ANGCS|nr:unnamed protein product [Angiostrongylus costaricensis]